MTIDPPKTFSVLATSSPLSPGLRPEVEGFLKNEGISLSYLLDPYAEYGWKRLLFSAHSPEERRKALFEFLMADDTSLLLAARGGVGAQEMLSEEYLTKVRGDRSTQKILCGFSDFCVLHSALASIDSITCIHGPSLLSFRDEVAEDTRRENLASLTALLSGGTEIIPAPEIAPLFLPDEIQGALVGGNLSILCSLVGTPFLAPCNQKILLLEDVGERPHKIYRNLCHLEQAGVFQEVVGVLLGEFLNCDHPQKKGPSVQEIFQQFFENKKIPVYCTSSFGHGARNRSLPLGKEVTLSGDGLHLIKPLCLVV